MSLADELEKLGQLHRTAQLSDEEFSRAKEKLLSSSGKEASSFSANYNVNVVRRSVRDRWFGGVCGGLAIYSNTESWLWRLIFVAFVCVFGTGFLLYLFAWIFIPESDSY
ncbi:PspC domain-containing protein [Undibacterium luofuense]|uniref:PspC domain-containing protein n=1 Tax=Undibacterium luofuense TaxID=2828733 RepID=UPI0030EB3DEF